MKGSWYNAFYRNPLLLQLSLVIILVAGVSSMLTIPRLEDPIITNRFAVIITAFPGATAERVESQVTEPIENQLQEFSEIKEINSSSRPNISVVNIELVDEVTDPDPVWSKIRDRLGEVANTLPQAASKPVLDEERGYAFSKFYAIQANNAKVPLPILKRYATELKHQILRYPGTDLVRLYGVSNEEVLVDVDIHKLSAIGLNMNKLSQIIRAADSKVPAGLIHQQEQSFSVELQGEFL
ncbi:MAG: efflux RND transporter permease subunit [Coxiellaceae bacterium]|nr:efflux RND transporter permease subunit [Coxiellaceae bacterium]